MRTAALITLLSSTASAAPNRDIDGDGFADAVIGDRALYFGSAKGLVGATAPQSPRASSISFGSLAIVGDVDGDGFADTVKGDPNCPDHAHDMPACEAGSIHLFLGGKNRLAAKPAVTRGVTAKNTLFGMQLVAPGDLDGDGKADVVVPAFDATYVYRGTAKGLADKPLLLPAGTVLPAGDINRDKRADLIILTPQSATLFYGGDPKRTLSLPRDKKEMFVSAAGHGDFDGDGFGDLALTIEKPFADKPLANAIIVYRGSANGLITTAAARFTRDHARAEFGSMIASVGDLDGDRRDDLVVLASCSKFVVATSSCEAGTAFVYLGSAKGLTTTPVAALSPARKNIAISGNALSPLGDLDGDKHADFAFGAYVYRGAKRGIANPKPPSL
jgi:hypothetical protein